MSAPTRPRVLVVGLGPIQTRQVADRTRRFPIDVIFRESVAGHTVPAADAAILTHFSTHASTRAVKEARVPWTFHRGGISGLVLTLREHAYPPLAAWCACGRRAAARVILGGSQTDYCQTCRDRALQREPEARLAPLTPPPLVLV